QPEDEAAHHIQLGHIPIDAGALLVVTTDLRAPGAARDLEQREAEVEQEGPGAVVHNGRPRRRLEQEEKGKGAYHTGRERPWLALAPECVRAVREKAYQGVQE